MDDYGIWWDYDEYDGFLYIYDGTYLIAKIWDGIPTPEYVYGILVAMNWI